MTPTKPALPPDILVQPIPGGRAYRLPWRHVPPPLWKQVTLMCLGGVLAGGAAVGLFYLVAVQPRQSFFVGIGSMTAVLALLMLGGAFTLLYTRCTVEVDGNELRLQEWYGPIKTELKRPLPLVRKLVTHHLLFSGRPLAGQVGTDPASLDASGEPQFAALEVVCEGAQSLFTAHTYPRAWILALAVELAERLQVPHEVAPLQGDVPKIIPFFNLKALIDDRDTFDEPVAPPDNGWQAHVETGVLRLTLPPLGFAREGNWFLLVLGTVFLLIGVNNIPLAMLNLGNDLSGLLFCLIPLGIATGAWGFAYRRAKTVIVLSVSEAKLTYHREGPLWANKHREWPRTEIAAVRVGPPKVSQKGVDRKAVYVHLSGGREQWLVETSRVQEMRWLATILRQTLGVPAVPVRPQPVEG